LRFAPCALRICSRAAKENGAVGLLMNRADLYPSSAVTPFQARLRELGYIEGQTITFETRYWEGTVEVFQKLLLNLSGSIATSFSPPVAWHSRAETLRG